MLSLRGGRSDDEDADETSDDFWEQDEGGLIQGMIGKDTNSVREALVNPTATPHSCIYTVDVRR